jgi:8-oxo-dGTP pyrophosphatase MutT (NUDIX family)
VAPFLTRLRSRVAHLYFLLAKPMTLGVRGVVIDENDRVLLVRHSYISGWHFPGGGVEARETVADALGACPRNGGFWWRRLRESDSACL